MKKFKEFVLNEGEIGDVEKLMKKGWDAKRIGKKKGYSPRRIKALAKMMELMKMLQQNEESDFLKRLKKTNPKEYKRLMKFKGKPRPVKEKYDAYYAMVDAKAMAKKYGGDPDDYIDKLMKKAGYKKDTYSGHGVWQWVKEGTMRAGIFDSDIKKRKDAARKLVFFLKSKRNLKIGPMNDKQGGSNKAIDSYIKELMKYVFDDLMIDGLYPTGKNADVKANDVVVKRLKKMGVRVK